MSKDQHVYEGSILYNVNGGKKHEGHESMYSKFRPIERQLYVLDEYFMEDEEEFEMCGSEERRGRSELRRFGVGADEV